MNKKDLKIVFYGTPDFAVKSLQAIIDAGYNVVAVVTAPDKPAGRGKKLTQSPVKKYAVEQNLKVLQPEKLKDPAFLEELKKLRPDLQVVVAFRMLPKEVWSLPPLGTFNLHASLLPQYRGASPINFALINGEKETGLTTFFIDDKIDTGNIILQEKTQI
jgi:methionyl-tRNA formyltransferase